MQKFSILSHDAYSEVGFVLVHMMSAVVMNECAQSIDFNKTKRSKLKESPVVGPRTRVEPAQHGQLTALFYGPDNHLRARTSHVSKVNSSSWSLN